MKTIIIIASILAGVTIFFTVKTRNEPHMTIRQKITKVFYPLIMKMGKTTVKSNADQKQQLPLKSVYELPNIVLLDGSSFNLSDCKGKKVIIVNTASDCGFTAQYEELENLYRQHKDSLIIVGFPANDFGNQEKYDNATIAGFCKKNYGVSFPVAEKVVVVKNNQQHPLYQWLTNENQNGWNNQAPTWNFCKYLIDENGTLIGFYNSNVKPEDVLR